MPNPLDFLINPIRRGVGGVRRGIGALEDQINPTRRQPMPPGADVNPAELEQVREYLTPGISGQPNPASRPRAVMPDYQPGGNLRDSYSGGASDRPAMPVNTRPRQVMPPLDAPATEAPALERPIATRPRFATPYKAAENEYVGEHGKRDWKEALKGGLYGMAMSGGQGGLGGLIGGFAGGALGQTIAPEQMAQARFAMGPGRRVLADQQMQRDDELYGLKVRGQEAQIEENRQQAEAAKRRDVFHNVPRNNSVIDTTGRQVYQAPQTPVAPPRPAVTTVMRNGVPTVYDYVNNREVGPAYVKPGADRQLSTGELRRQAEDDVLAEDGNPAQIEEDTWQGRKQAVLDAQLSPLERQILYEPQKPVPKKRWDAQQGSFVESNEPPSLEEQAKVRQRVAAIEEAERRKIRSGIQGEIKRKAGVRVGGKSSARPAMPASGGKLKPISRAMVEQYAKDNGVSFEKALEDARADGYDVR